MLIEQRNYPYRAELLKCNHTQILATTAKNFLLLDLGLSVAFPTIVIPALRGLSKATNPHETLELTDVQASWLGENFATHLE